MKLLQKLDFFLNQRKHPLDLSIARILFFVFFIQFCLKQSPSTVWFKLDWQSHWIPISFFKLLPLSLIQLTTFQIFHYMMLVGAFFALVGLFTQFAIITCFVGALFSFGLPLNFGKIHHSNHFMVMTLFFLCFTRNHFLSLDFLIKKRLNQLLMTKVKLFENRCWPIVALAVYMSTAYFESGYQKLKNSGLTWFHPDNLSLIILTRPSMTELGGWAAQQPWLMFILATVTFIIEFGAPLIILNRKLFYLLGFSLFSLHFGTYFIMGSHGDFRAYSACFVFWVPWMKIYNLPHSKMFGV